MPSLSKALQEAVIKGAKGAKVISPADKALAAKLAEEKALKEATEVELKRLTEGPTTKTAEPEVASKAKEAPVKAAPEPTIEDPLTGATKEPVPDAVPVDEMRAKNIAPPEVPVRDAPPILPDSPKVGASETPVEGIAKRMAALNIKNYDLEASYMPNIDAFLDKAKTVEDLRAFVADLADTHKGKIDEARRGVITDQKRGELSRELLISGKAVNDLMSHVPGGTANAETMTAGQQVLHAAVTRAKELGDKVASGVATEAERVNFMRHLQIVGNTFPGYMGARAENARANRAIGVPLPAAAEDIARVAELAKMGGVDIDRLARAMSLIDTTPGVIALAQGSLFKRTARGILSLMNRLFVNGILTGYRTTVRNISSSAIMQQMTNIELAAASYVGKALPGTDHVRVGQALANFHGQMSATADGWRAAVKTAKTGRTVDDVLQYETKGDMPMTSYWNVETPWLRRVLDGIDSAIDAPTKRFLAAQDEFFKATAYRGYLEMQAMRELQDRFVSTKLTPDEAEDFVRNFMENPPPNTEEAALAWAREQTFQTPLGETGQYVQGFVHQVPVLRILAPFIRTPVNVYKQTVYRSPMAVLAPKFWQDVGKGGQARDLALTRFALGSATAALVAYWVAGDEMTGSGPQHPDAQAQWQLTGRRPYSKRVTNPITGETEWHGYKFLGEVGEVMGMIADIAELQAYAANDTETLQDETAKEWQAAGLIIAGLANNVSGKTGMQGVEEFMSFWHSPAENIAPYARKFPTKFDPYSGFQNTVRELNDPYYREARSVIGALKNNTPGYSDNLPLSLDVFANPKMKNASSLLGVMSIIPESKVNYDPVVVKVNQLLKDTRMASLRMPSRYAEGGLKLTDREHNALTVLSRRMVAIDGKVFHDYLLAEMQGATFQSLPPVGQVDYIRKIQNNFDEEGRVLLEKQDVAYAHRVSQWRMKVARVKHNQ